MVGVGLRLAGLMGDIIGEAAQTALSCMRSRADELGPSPDYLEGREVHVDVPAGAVPKDGPSIGITLTMALVPLILPRRNGPDVTTPSPVPTLSPGVRGEMA